MLGLAQPPAKPVPSLVLYLTPSPCSGIPPFTSFIRTVKNPLGTQATWAPDVISTNLSPIPRVPQAQEESWQFCPGCVSARVLSEALEKDSGTSLVPHSHASSLHASLPVPSSVLFLPPGSQMPWAASPGEDATYPHTQKYLPTIFHRVEIEEFGRDWWQMGGACNVCHFEKLRLG